MLLSRRESLSNVCACECHREEGEFIEELLEWQQMVTTRGGERDKKEKTRSREGSFRL